MWEDLKMRSLIAVAALAVSLSACATATPADQNLATKDYDALKRECDAKGGILVPTGANSANERVNYVCDIKQGSHVSK
jgi:hypothetical protein